MKASLGFMGISVGWKCWVLLSDDEGLEEVASAFSGDDGWLILRCHLSRGYLWWWRCCCCDRHSLLPHPLQRSRTCLIGGLQPVALSVVRRSPNVACASLEDCSQWLRCTPPTGAFGAVRREPVPQCGLLGRRALACPYDYLGRNGDCFDWYAWILFVQLRGRTCRVPKESFSLSLKDSIVYN